MIYEPVLLDMPIRQGDIFRSMPRLDFAPSQVAVVDADETSRQANWLDLLQESGAAPAVAALVSVKPVNAVVITQDCDARRGEYLSLCQIDSFIDTMGGGNCPTVPKKWQSLIIKHSRAQLRWFYLPADPAMGFAERRAVDFRVVLRLPRIDLEEMKSLRVCRLNEIASEHFRESLAQFVRRYPYDEWYPLTKEEFLAYAEEKEDAFIRPFPYQQ